MRRLISLLFILLSTKFTVSILVQQHYQQRQQPYQNSQVGYNYNQPTVNPNTYKPISPLFPSYQRIQAAVLQPQNRPELSPFSFHPSSQKVTFSSGSHYHPSHLPQSIHLDIPPALLHNFLSPNDHVYFAEDGRLLKQYEVMEQIIGDLEPTRHFLGPSPLYFDSLASKYVAQGVAYQGQILKPVTQNHGPIALGSGSLGYIQLANGIAHLGSGSLGYISARQANQAILEAKTRKALAPPGPLHFGHSFGN